jgi:hypothetical protein
VRAGRTVSRRRHVRQLPPRAHAGRGLGTWLLRFAEEQAPAEVRAFRLHTGARSHRNLALYERFGYRRGTVHDGVVTLTKPVLATAAS